jgi:hypothetical protein
MSSISGGWGLKIANAPGMDPVSFRKALPGGIASGYGTAIGENSPVKMLAGLLVAAVGTASGDSTGGILGTFQGVEYTDAQGVRQESNQWLASTVATNVVAYYTDNPYVTYEVYANGSIAQANNGNEIDFNNVTVNTSTGLCTGTVDTTTLSGSGTQRLLRIVGITPGADNAFGDAFTIVQVQIAKHQFVSPVTGIS